MNKIYAIWSISLDCDFPSCEEYVDLFDDEGFLGEVRFEHGYHRSSKLDYSMSEDYEY